MSLAPDERELLIRIDERVTDAFREIKDIKKSLHGNGRPGLNDRVKHLESSMEGQASSKERIAMWLGILILGLALLSDLTGVA